MAITPVTINDPLAIAKVNAAITEANKVAGKAEQTALAAETMARGAAISAEATARDAAVSGEASARATAIAGEATARAAAISAEAAARVSGDALRITYAEAAMGPVRPGEAIKLFTSDVDGDPSAVTPLTDGNRAVGAHGAVGAINGAGAVAPIAVWRLEPGRQYRARFVVQRAVDTADPSNDAIRLGLRWLKRDKSGLSSTTLADLLDVTVADGRLEYSYNFALTAADNIDVKAALTSVYVRPFVRTFGSGVTHVELIDVADLTDTIEWSPDVSEYRNEVAGITQRVDVIEDRLDMLPALPIGDGNATNGGAAAIIRGEGDYFSITPTDLMGSFNSLKEFAFDAGGDAIWTAEGGFRTTGNLIVTDDGSFGGNLAVVGDAAVEGNATIGGTIDVTGEAAFQDDVRVAGHVDITLTLDVQGNGILQSDADVGENLTVGGTSTFTGAGSFLSTLAAAGAVTFGSTLDVTGAATFADDLSVGGNTDLTGTLAVGGNTTLQANLDVIGNTTIGGTIAVTGDASFLAESTFAGTVGIAGATTIDDTLGVTGAASFGSTMAVTGAGTFSSTLSVTGNVDLAANLDVDGDTVLAGMLGVTGAVGLLGTLDVGGDASFDANVTIGGTLAASGDVLMSADLDVTGDTTVGGALAVTGPSTLASLTVTGAAIIGDAAGDAVTIQGTEVKAYSSGLLDNADALAWRASLNVYDKGEVDTAIQSSVDALEDADAALATAISDEATARADADTALQTGVDTKAPIDDPTFTGTVTLPSEVIGAFPVFADDAAAGTGGLTTGRVYATATGELRIKL
jgi:predicted acyltransferase (DUF342 family)